MKRKEERTDREKEREKETKVHKEKGLSDLK